MSANRAGTVRVTANASPFVKRLAQIVRDQKVTYRELASEAGLSVKALDNWYRHGTSPTVDALETVLSVLGYTLRIGPIDVTKSEDWDEELNGASPTHSARRRNARGRTHAESAVLKGRIRKRAADTEVGETCASIAAAFGVSASYVHRVINGKR